MNFEKIVAAGCVVVASFAAPAAPVTLNLHGAVTGYDYIDLSAGLPVGAVVDLSLTFNETFSDSTYSFADPLVPVSGTMSVGSMNYTFTDANPFSYSYNFTTGEVNWVLPQFTGTGPTAPGGGDFFGLFARFTPALTVSDLKLGYGFTTVYPEVTITNYGYANISADRYSITPAGQVPEPATLSLLAAGLVIAGVTRRRRKTAHDRA